MSSDESESKEGGGGGEGIDELENSVRVLEERTEGLVRGDVGSWTEV